MRLVGSYVKVRCPACKGAGKVKCPVTYSAGGQMTASSGALIPCPMCNGKRSVVLGDQQVEAINEAMAQSGT